ncbi:MULTISPECIES: hypothetical protein [unclassified Methylobacterium]|uniref:hypothetical protein n=1 Tax=unclassified Methylobacterium TaxID=2615210 RepID=UPI0011C1D74E|nr:MULTISPECIES: hypothetical protein [unclassified Methylobacterium]QEE39915.1 hypothetical protein FVA80_14075 [Methylobacterium sp. WL1]TXN56581.1 hypothetical protein FV241_14730 [Methylobacterium sp. WL2]
MTERVDRWAAETVEGATYELTPEAEAVIRAFAESVPLSQEAVTVGSDALEREIERSYGEPLDAVPDAVPDQREYVVRVGWPEFYSKAVRLPEGSDVAPVTRAAKAAAADFRWAKDRERWPAFSWEDDRFLAPDELAPRTFIVGPSQALIERQGDTAGYHAAREAMHKSNASAAEVAAALGRGSPDGSQGNIWTLFDARRATQVGDWSGMSDRTWKALQDGKVHLAPGGHKTETKKAARWASVLIAQILGDGSRRQSEAGVDVAAEDAPNRLRGSLRYDTDILGVFYGDGTMTFGGDAEAWCQFRDMAARIVSVPGRA